MHPEILSAHPGPGATRTLFESGPPVAPRPNASHQKKAEAARKGAGDRWFERGVWAASPLTARPATVDRMNHRILLSRPLGSIRGLLLSCISSAGRNPRIWTATRRAAPSLLCCLCLFFVNCRFMEMLDGGGWGRSTWKDGRLLRLLLLAAADDAAASRCCFRPPNHWADRTSFTQPTRTDTRPAPTWAEARSTCSAPGRLATRSIDTRAPCLKGREGA